MFALNNGSKDPEEQKENRYCNGEVCRGTWITEVKRVSLLRIYLQLFGEVAMCTETGIREPKISF